MPMSCPQYGHNSKGIASLIMEGERPVVVEHVETTGFIHVKDIETHKRYTIFRDRFRMTDPIPSRYRSYVFDAVAPFWKLALEAWPDAVVVKSTLWSSETLTRKMRESREAKKLYGWKHPDINELLWNAHAENISITPRAGSVVLGSPESKREKPEILLGELKQKDIIVEWQLLSDLEHFCAIKPLLKPLPYFIVSNLNAELISELESRYDVGFLPIEGQENKWQVL